MALEGHTDEVVYSLGIIDFEFVSKVAAQIKRCSSHAYIQY